MQVMGSALQFGAVKRLRHPAFSINFQRGYQDMAFIITGPKDRQKYAPLACQTGDTRPQWTEGTDHWEPANDTRAVGNGKADIIILRCYRPDNRFSDPDAGLMVRRNGGFTAPKEEEWVPASTEQIEAALNLVYKRSIEPEDRQMVQDAIIRTALARLPKLPLREARKAIGALLLLTKD